MYYIFEIKFYKFKFLLDRYRIELNYKVKVYYCIRFVRTSIEIHKILRSIYVLCFKINTQF